MKVKIWIPVLLLVSVGTCWKYEGKNEGLQPLIYKTLNVFLESSPASHSYFIYDGHYDISAKEITLLMERHTVTLIMYKDFNLLRSLLEDVFFDQGKSNVILLCSTTSMLDIFSQVTEQKLESIRRVWLIFTEENLGQRLSSIIREGTQVIMTKMLMNMTKVEMYASIPTIDNGMGFELVGRGASVPNRNGNQPSDSINIFKPPLVESMGQMYSDFGGRELIVSANNDWPFFGLIILDNGTAIPDAGIDINLVEALGEKLNFTYRVMLPPDGQWGGPQPDGTVTGLIGLVARRESHLSIDEITITDVRESVIDFSTPYMEDSTRLISPSPKPLSRALAILSTFTYEVWGALILALVVIGPILVAIDAVEKGHGERRWTFSETYFNTFRSLVIQGNKLKTARSAPRLLLAIWFLFCVIIYALYGSTLTAILAVPSYEKPINTILDAIDVTASDDFAIGTVKETNLELLFKEATFGSYKLLWERMAPDDLVTTIREGFKKILVEKYIYVISGIVTKVYPIEYGEWNFHIGRESIFPQNYGIACPSGAPYLPAFNEVIRRLTEAGIIDMWVRRELQTSEVKRRMGHPDEVTQGDQRNSQGTGGLTLDHLQGAFFMVGIGVFLAAIVLIIEILFHRFARSDT